MNVCMTMYVIRQHEESGDVNIENNVHAIVEVINQSFRPRDFSPAEGSRSMGKSFFAKPE